MVLKYLTECKAPIFKEGEHEKECPQEFRDQWNFIDGIIGASIYFDKGSGTTIAELEFENKPAMGVALYYEAYLLNENGKTIEKVRC